MKKFLSLVLALVLTMSLVTVSAGAEGFKDSKSITYAEAVEVLTAVDVIDGYTDGTFKAGNGLTRGAAAKIVCNLVLGPTTAEALKADTAPYTDVPVNHVHAGYIAYCQREGIVTGYDDGSFRPGDPLSAYAFMKMLLCALGYDYEIEGYTGANWSVNVAKRALNIGMDAGMVGELKGADPVDRQTACLFALNTLKADMVEYDARTSVSIDGAEVLVGGSGAKYADANKNDGQIELDGVLQFAEQFFGDLKVVDAGYDDFGRPSNTWYLKNDEIGTYTDISDLVAVFEGDSLRKIDIYETLGKSVHDALVDGEATLTHWIDGNATIVAVNDVEKWSHKTNSGDLPVCGNGDLTEVYINDDNDVTIVAIRSYVYEAVGGYNDAKDTVTLLPVDGTGALPLDPSVILNSEDFPVIAELEDEDFVIVTGVAKAGKLQPKNIEWAGEVTGEVTQSKVAPVEKATVTLDKRTFQYAVTAGDHRETEYTIGKPATLVLNPYNYVVAVSEAVVLEDYVFVEKFAATSGLNAKAQAAMIFSDGTVIEGTIKELADEELTGSALLEKADYNKTYGTKWYRYSKNSDGEYTLYGINPAKCLQADTVTYKGAVDISYNNKVRYLAGEAALADDDTIMLVRDKDDVVTVYTGVTNIPEIFGTTETEASVYPLVDVESNYTNVVFVDLDGITSVAGAASGEFVYILRYNGLYHTTAYDTYYAYIVRQDGKEVTLKSVNKIDVPKDDTDNTADYIYDVAHYMTTNEDGMIVNFEMVTADNGVDIFADKDVYSVDAPITYSAGTLSLGDEKFVVTKDTKVDLYVRHSDLLYDQYAKYEPYEGTTAKTVADMVANVDYEYNYAARTTGKDGKVLEEVIITINNDPYAYQVLGITVDGKDYAGYATRAIAAENLIPVEWDGEIEYTSHLKGDSLEYTVINEAYAGAYVNFTPNTTGKFNAVPGKTVMICVNARVPGSTTNKHQLWIGFKVAGGSGEPEVAPAITGITVNGQPYTMGNFGASKTNLVTVTAGSTITIGATAVGGCVTTYRQDSNLDDSWNSTDPTTGYPFTDSFQVTLNEEGIHFVQIRDQSNAKQYYIGIKVEAAAG